MDTQRQTDHIHVVNQLKEKCREYNIPLCIAFINYKKAFDSVEQTLAVLTLLQEHPWRGIRQGDTISSKLFMAALETIFRRLTWETRGLKIDGEYLSHLCFADNILIIKLCANTPHELQQMLQDLADESDNQGLKMNKSKPKLMMETDTPIYVNNTQIENVESYIYLGQRYTTRDKHQDKEIQRRITAGWTAFAKHHDIFKGNT